MFGAEHEGKYDIVYADPPWAHFGDPNKMGAAGKEYGLMSQEEVCSMPMRSLLRDPKVGAFFIWATCPRLDLAVDAIRAWGLCYRGVAFNWIKTKRDGTPIGAQGVPPTSTKPLTELCLLATTKPRGRPFPLLSSKILQTVFDDVEDLPEGNGAEVRAPRTRVHSEKPKIVRDRIVGLYGDRPRIELFARDAADGWARWGNEAPPAGLTEHK